MGATPGASGELPPDDAAHRSCHQADQARGQAGAQLALIRAGAVIGMCQVPLARRDRNLVRVLPKMVQLPLET